MRDTEFLTTCTVLGCMDLVRVRGSPGKKNHNVYLIFKNINNLVDMYLVFPNV